MHEIANIIWKKFQQLFQNTTVYEPC
jgi:hypothetical protein